MIRVVSWNVLADAYVKNEYYPHTPAEIFDKNARRKAVIARLAASKAEVLCLQEVDRPLFAAAEEALPDFKGRHYKKLGRGEGVAIFLRQALTTEPEWKELAFSDRSGHVALGATFAGVTIVTTHLKWHPVGTPPGEHQGRSELAEILRAWPSGSRVIAGDLNATADSDVLAVAFEAGFKDAYATQPEACTCNSNGKKKRIDFILHTSDFSPTPAFLSTKVEDDTPLPSATEPSDHVAIEARLDR